MKTISPEKTRIPALDGVRGMAILMVLFWHFWQGMEVYQAHLPFLFVQWGKLDSIGQKGVDLFFVLSGFLITGILLRTKGSTHYFRNFYIRRSLRIFPLYYVVVIACIVAGIIWSLPTHQWRYSWWYLFYIQNFALNFWPDAIRGPGHFWSLAVEEHFYLFWPLAVLLLSRNGLLKLSLLLIGSAIVIRGVFMSLGLNVFYFTFCRMDTLAIGALLAILYADKNQWRQVVLWTHRLLLPITAIALVTFFLLSGTTSYAVYNFKFTFYAALFGVLLILTLSPGRLNPMPNLFQLSWLRGIGKISYAMYVFHPFIFHKIEGLFFMANWSPFRGMLWISMTIDLILAFGFTILVASISWVIFEHPLIKLKDQFPYEDRKKPVTVTESP